MQVVPNNDACRNEFTCLHCNNDFFYVLVILLGLSTGLLGSWNMMLHLINTHKNSLIPL
jgi:hypothetical protein